MSLVGNKALFACAGFTIVLLVLLLSLSFSYLEYYEYGLSQRKSTGSVDTSKVYSGGRYFVGPDATFIKYRADAHQVNLEQLAVFSAGASESSIGTSFMLDIMFSYTLKEEEIGALHRESAKSYKSVIEARTKEAIKNEAVFVTFQEYFTERLVVEARFATQSRNDGSRHRHFTANSINFSWAESLSPTRSQGSSSKQRFNSRKMIKRSSSSKLEYRET